MAPPKVGLMVQRIERKYGPVSTQTSKESQRRSSEPVWSPSKQKNSIWFNTHPLGHEHLQQALEQDTSTSDGDHVTSVTPQVVQEEYTFATMCSSCAEEAGAKGKQPCEAMRVEHEGPDSPASNQERYLSVGLSPLSLAIRNLSVGTGTSGIYVPPHRRTVRIKTENAPPQAPSLEVPQRHPSHVNRRHRSQIRIPSPIVEQFYRSAVVKPEEEDKLPDGKEVLPLSLESTKPMNDQEVFQRDVKVKLQGPSHAHYIPNGASDGRFLAQAILSRNAHVPDNASLLTYGSDGLRLGVTDSTSPLDLNTPEQSDSTASSAPRPGTEFSYLKPLTPTPFSTPYGLTNALPYATNVHFVSGSLLEGMRRRTKWGDRTRLPEQTTLMTQGRYESSTERLCDIESKKEDGKEEGKYQTKTCAWYILPFCRCCRWTKTAIAQSSNTSRPPSHIEHAVVLRDEKTKRIKTRDASLPSTVITASKGVKRRKWWQLRQRKLPTDNESKTKIAERSIHGGLEGKRTPQLHLQGSDSGETHSARSMTD
jgi:hypothetical protein